MELTGVRFLWSQILTEQSSEPEARRGSPRRAGCTQFTYVEWPFRRLMRVPGGGEDDTILPINEEFYDGFIASPVAVSNTPTVLSVEAV